MVGGVLNSKLDLIYHNQKLVLSLYGEFKKRFFFFFRLSLYGDLKRKKKKNSKQMLTINVPECGLSDGH